jgi:uncharacterized protein (TIGR03437 family)
MKNRMRPIVSYGLIAILAASAASTQTLTTLIGLGSPTNSQLIQGKDGYIYGATYNGVYKIALDGTVAAIVALVGDLPNTLVQASDGNFYSTTANGGLGRGTVFRMTPSGTVTILYRFGTVATDGGSPAAGLIQASDGNLYGVTVSTVFRITLSGTLTTLYTFGTQAGDGRSPSGPLLQGVDGNLYGMTQAGGTGAVGTIFKISLAGAMTTLYSFTSATGSAPIGTALIQASDGNFYGTTSKGGTYNGGTIFRMTPAGVVSFLYNFSAANPDGTLATDGVEPVGGLIQATDGNLYGTTLLGGGTGVAGTLFRMSLSGTFTALAAFSGSEGGAPGLGLLQASDGNLYGTTSLYGYTGFGSVFKYFLTASPPPPPAIATNGIVPVYSNVSTIQQGEWISIYGTNLAGTATVWNGDFPLSLGGTSVLIDGKPAYLWFVSPTQLNVQVPTDTTTGPISVTVTTAGGTATSTVTMAQIAPMFDLLDSKHVAGIILRPDGSGGYGGGSYDVLGPTGTSLGYPTVAAKAGDTVELFGVGFGPTTPAVPAGAPFSGSAPATSSVNLVINGQTITPTYVGETSAGLIQINLTIPPGLGTGDVTLQAIVGGIQTPAGVMMSVQ